MPIDAETLRSVGILLWYWGFRPASEPAAHLVEAAMRDVPKCLKKLFKKDQDSNPPKIKADRLLEQLAADHPGPPAAFAVFRLIQEGLLGAEIRDYEVPEAKQDYSDWMGGPNSHHEFYIIFENGEHSGMFYSLNGVRRDHRIFVWAEPELWDWWRLLPEPSSAVPVRIESLKSTKRTPTRKRKKSLFPTEKQMKAYGLHRTGATHSEIGQQMGISRQAAAKLIKKANEILHPKRRSPQAKALPTDRRGQSMIEDTSSEKDDDSLGGG